VLYAHRFLYTRNTTQLIIKKAVLWMWRRVYLVWTDISEELITSIFRVDKSASEEPAWAAATCSQWFLARGFFYPENGADMFLRNVGSHKIYTAPHHRRRHPSYSPPWKPQILQLITLLLYYVHSSLLMFPVLSQMNRSQPPHKIVPQNQHLYTLIFQSTPRSPIRFLQFTSCD
jgi:hypothetical protein